MSILSAVGATVIMFVGIVLSLINLCYLVGDASPKRGEESLEDYQERIAERNMLRKQERSLAFLGGIGLVTECLLLALLLVQQTVSFFDRILLIGIVLLQSAALLRRTTSSQVAKDDHTTARADTPDVQNPGLAAVANRIKSTRTKARQWGKDKTPAQPR